MKTLAVSSKAVQKVDMSINKNTSISDANQAEIPGPPPHAPPLT